VIFNASGVRDCHFQHENFLLADKSTEAGKSKKPTAVNLAYPNSHRVQMLHKTTWTQAEFRVLIGFHFSSFWLISVMVQIHTEDQTGSR